ncbi:kinase-like domain-containing protein [Tuber borchii]|uniref:Kinase-like domain-containing protein n=1 Tax=Tuber borchii TaxID=42251 RepID=A0A2T6ZU56_TUBBO|nr:kinase-like domain-containing protein [Tuber borchii]
MDKTQSDLVEGYKLETEFFQDHVRHTRYVEKAENRNRKVKEDWSNCGELGRGGFGVVYRQIQKATGRYRAVKAIDRRQASRLDCSRELLVMAKLANYPSLFVRFLGWFEGPETLYIAMEYLEECDLTKHISTPLSQETVQNISKQILEGLKVMHQEGITHRDIKPANIFVVSMSPVRVKLGDFGASKWIQAPDTTTLHTQVSTPLYGAPEVLGLDSNSETSDYTNSVDIWSLGCVIYELLVGKRLFASWDQVSRYFFGKRPFPEDSLRGLSRPTDDAGVSLLKSMLSIQPGGRPTAADALNDVWLAGLTSNKEHRGGDEGRTPPRWDERTHIRKRKNRPASRSRREKRRSKRGPPTGDDTGCMTGDVGLGMNPRSQGSGEPSPLKL